ncbi:hypothetical protein M2306_001754 [Myroides gitamensis]|uniref:hypothetical protein n=1 Tax=Myroides odoratus TaxID=256 RepID=UPI002169FEFD|nr:hypothetical protein [Myroides odoratus]MCS4240188.1 hypothetical protein [Myroides odoratus]MDH6601060.1 hypothetical protein [Myroides gitamensis]
MKTFGDILNSQINFLTRRDKVLSINYEFYLNLVYQIGNKGQIPDGSLIKYQKGTNSNINIVEEWVELNDDETCSMRIGIVVNNTNHLVSLSTKQEKSNIDLTVTTDLEVRNYQYNLENNKISDLNFDDVVSNIFEDIVNSYNNWFNI